MTWIHQYTILPLCLSTAEKYPKKVNSSKKRKENTEYMLQFYESVKSFVIKLIFIRDLKHQLQEEDEK